MAGALATALAALTMAAGSIWMIHTASGHIYAEADVPPAPVALVLGARVAADGTPSPFLAARLDVAKRLYDSGKVRAILVSGDNRRWDYNEPASMQVYLVARGVPAAQVPIDYAGFDTYDSCARAKRVFGVTEAIVVTQSYHLDRAVALCRDQGIDATGVGDDSVRVFEDRWRYAIVRERLAALKAAYDVISRRDPVFLGREETTVDEAVRG